jgi:membrane-associated protein
MRIKTITYRDVRQNPCPFYWLGLLHITIVPRKGDDMNFIYKLVDFIIHIDKHLAELASQYGQLAYGILFVIVFCETGLVVTPFLPGDSLLFAAGALATKGAFNVHLLAILLFIAAVLGDAVNYAIGRRMGPAVFERKNSKVFKPEYLARTHRYFEKYGSKTIVLARFVPIVRTFAPFLAGVGTMSYAKFAMYNITGALAWVGLFTYGGYLFGGAEIVQKNFKLVILAIIILSILPGVIEVIRARREARSAPAA